MLQIADGWRTCSDILKSRMEWNEVKNLKNLNGFNSLSTSVATTETHNYCSSPKTAASALI